MKRLTCVLAIVFGVVALATTPVVADTEGTVTAATAGLFAGSAALAGVSLDGLEVGTGVFISSDGSATGSWRQRAGRARTAAVSTRSTLPARSTRSAATPDREALRTL